MKHLLVIGLDSVLEAACAAAEACERCRIESMALPSYDGGPPDLAALEGYSTSQWRAFVAAGPEFLNLLRQRLFDEAKRRGFNCVSLAHPGANIGTNVVIQENVLVHAGATIGAGASVGPNTVIGAGATVGAGTVIEASSWIASTAIVGDDARIGRNTVISPGVCVARGARVGSWCELAKPGYYGENIPDRSFFHPLFDRRVRISG